MEGEFALSPLLDLLPGVPGYAALLQGLEPGGQVLAGVADPAKPFLLAALHRRLRGGGLVLASTPEAAKVLYDGLAAWSPPGTTLLLLPEPDALPYERLSPDPATVQERLKALWLLSRGEGIVVGSAWAAAFRTIPFPDYLASCQELRPGMEVSLSRLLEGWLQLGYTVEPAVEVPGAVCRRGGIVDIFPPTSPRPIRLELAGNQLESLREFDPASQRSLAPVGRAVITPAREMLLRPGAIPSLNLAALSPESRERYQEELAKLDERQSFPGMELYAPLFNQGSLLDYLHQGGWLVLDEPREIESALSEMDQRSQALREGRIASGELPPDFPLPYLSAAELLEQAKGVPRRLLLERWGEHRLPFSAAPAYGGRWSGEGGFLPDLERRLSTEQVVAVVSSQPHRLAELLREADIPIGDARLQPGAVHLFAAAGGGLPPGWLLEVPPALLLTDSEVFGAGKERRPVRRRPVRRAAFQVDFQPGDYVVHIEHGIARFAGTERMSREGEEREYLVLEYAEGDKLFVPTDQVDRVGRYIGAGGEHPTLSRLGTEEWKRLRERVQKATEELARDLLELYATRQVAPGFAFSPDSPWQAELEEAFPYIETPDQAEAVRQVKAGMELPQPMDRLVCGDVGYGKTEVALRAAFKAVQDGKQVALLVPTTVLAQQHYRTFSERLAPFPVKVAMLSRFLAEREQAEVVAGLSQGRVDIAIGTHRLLQKDVGFKDLGLVIVDEEQRFGVKHKERLKQMRQEVDVLTLSATPIPRTLYMSLAGIRDMSLIDTPPEERQPVKTYVAEYDPPLIRQAILRELERGGQVFLVHNRIYNIRQMAAELEELVPEARFAIAHGRMDEEELERVMLDFAQGKYDVLVCTTIIESGLDMPRVNTLIVDEADRLGLTQLYQLRGRVGRGATRAYAYFLFHRGKQLTPQAQARLATIYQATELGAGFQIAMRDLEIRGAGNLLGMEQSGHIGAVGFDLYTRLLAEAVAELQGKPLPPPPPQVSISLPLPALLPEHYVPDLASRLAIYHRLVRLSQPDEVESIAAELRDRFGPLPQEAENLLYTVRLKALAVAAAVESIGAEDGKIVLQMRGGRTVPRERLGGLSGVVPGVSQVRLEMRRLGERWQQALEAVLLKMTATDES